MIALLVTACLSVALCDPLEDGLKSGPALLKLFSDYSTFEGKQYSAEEAPLRLRLFRAELKSVVETNKAGQDWEAGLNLFSDMTQEEKSRYLGVNGTAPTDAPFLEDLPSSRGTVDWRNGRVTPVKNQGSCGSCWAFAAIGSIETAYAQQRGSAVSFSEQQVLDCTYEGRRDGCQGGWYHDAFNVLRSTALPTMSQYRYAGRDLRCDRNRPNSVGQITGYQQVQRSEGSLLSALNRGAVSVAFYVSNAAQRYRSGIFRDNYCSQTPNHAVTAVGYSRDAIIVKNSWGTHWGSQGYIYFARNHHNCGLYTNNAIVTLRAAGQEVEE